MCVSSWMMIWVLRDSRREVRRQGDGLVERVGVQRLGSAEDRGHCLDGRPHDVVVRVLLGERPSRRLAVGAKHHRLRLLGGEALHDLPPEQPRGAELGHLQVEVHADAEEEAEPAGEFIHVQPLGQCGLHVLLAVGQGERQLERLRGAGLLHVIAGNRDRVELRHVVGGVLDDVGDDPHRRLGRVNVRVADHELLEDVVLDGARKLLLRDPLFLGRHDVAGQHRQHRAVHGHRDRDPVERDATEENFHVLDRIDRHACLTHVALDAGVVRVIAAVSRQVERHRYALPAAGQRLLVERVRFLGGGEPGVLANGPRPDRVHCRLRPTHERLEARQRVGVGQTLHVLVCVQRLDFDAFGSFPVQGGDIASRHGLGRRLLPRVKVRGIQQFLTHGRTSNEAGGAWPPNPRQVLMRSANDGHACLIHACLITVNRAHP